MTPCDHGNPSRTECHPPCTTAPCQLVDHAPENLLPLRWICKKDPSQPSGSSADEIVSGGVCAWGCGWGSGLWGNVVIRLRWKVFKGMNLDPHGFWIQPLTRLGCFEISGRFSRWKCLSPCLASWGTIHAGTGRSVASRLGSKLAPWWTLAYPRCSERKAEQDGGSLCSWWTSHGRREMVQSSVSHRALAQDWGEDCKKWSRMGYKVRGSFGWETKLPWQVFET